MKQKITKQFTKTTQTQSDVCVSKTKTGYTQFEQCRRDFVFAVRCQLDKQLWNCYSNVSIVSRVGRREETKKTSRKNVSISRLRAQLILIRFNRDASLCYYCCVWFGSSRERKKKWNRLSTISFKCPRFTHQNEIFRFRCGGGWINYGAAFETSILINQAISFLMGCIFVPIVSQNI